MAPTGLYVHIPFCRQLCPYCDFAVAVRKDPPHAAYADALIAEWQTRRVEAGEISTIYFGGGTPAMWEPAQLRRFLRALGEVAPAEVTIEANPHDIDAELLSQWADAGIDRVSVGVQSFDDDVLRALGRDHDAERARRAVEQVVTSGNFRVSLDLIYAGPRYRAGIAEADAAQAAALGTEHVSAYELTVEPRTVFGRRSRAGTLNLAAPEQREDWSFEMVEALAAHGFERYEVSSYGRDGARAIHNSSYWLGVDYLGIGVGAHSFVRRSDGGAQRRANVRQLRNYLAGDPGELWTITAAEHLLERLFLAARTTIGVPWADLRATFSTIPSNVWDEVLAAADRLARDGLLEAGPQLRATHAGLDLADTIAERFAEQVLNVG